MDTTGPPSGFRVGGITVEVVGDGWDFRVDALFPGRTGAAMIRRLALRLGMSGDLHLPSGRLLISTPVHRVLVDTGDATGSARADLARAGLTPEDVDVVLVLGADAPDVPEGGSEVVPGVRLLPVGGACAVALRSGGQEAVLLSGTVLDEPPC